MRRLWFWIRLAVVAGASAAAFWTVLANSRRTPPAGGSSCGTAGTEEG